MANSLITLQEIVEQTTDLPSIPAAAVRVIQETDSALSTAAHIAEVLAQDQSLTIRILRLANSAYFGLSRRVDDLTEAVVVLGMRNVRNLAMVACSYPWMVRPLKGYALGPRQLWSHSFSIAVGAQLVAKQARIPNDDVAFTAGLLADVGKSALSVWLEDKLAALIVYATREGMTFDEAERKVLGYDHAQVGEYLAAQWNFPTSITQVIRWHHQPSSLETPDPIVDCVHVGDYLTMIMGYGLGGDGLQYGFDTTTLERLQLTTDHLDQITDEFVTAHDRYELMFEELQVA